MKRIILFLATNLAVVLLLHIIVSILGLDYRLEASGVNWLSVLGFCFVIGMGGSFISLAISKWMAKNAMGVQLIDTPQNADEQWLVQTVSQQAKQAGIAMPAVGFFESPEPNAFATGPSRNNALVAVSTGLLQHMSRAEVEAVLAHEVSHVGNGDMVTMALVQGVVNTFVMFLARAVAMVVDNLLRSDEEGGGLGGLAYFAVVFVAEIIFGILASIIVMWFSRQREYRADAGGAKLAGRQKMIAALRSLQRVTEPQDLPGQMAAFGISGKNQGIMALFLSHPPLEERIAALEASQ